MQNSWPRRCSLDRSISVRMCLKRDSLSYIPTVGAECMCGRDRIASIWGWRNPNHIISHQPCIHSNDGDESQNSPLHLIPRSKTTSDLSLNDRVCRKNTHVVRWFQWFLTHRLSNFSPNPCWWNDAWLLLVKDPISVQRPNLVHNDMIPQPLKDEIYIMETHIFRDMKMSKVMNR